jgi:hypothetical protein
MWTTKNRKRYDRRQLRYPSDLTDQKWARVAPLTPPGRVWKWRWHHEPDACPFGSSALATVDAVLTARRAVACLDD